MGEYIRAKAKMVCVEETCIYWHENLDVPYMPDMLTLYAYAYQWRLYSI